MTVGKTELAYKLHIYINWSIFLFTDLRKNKALSIGSVFF